MVRKLALAVSLTLGSLPLSVYGIGLGDIKAYSALNQNFKGEIQLLSVPRGELDAIRVKLASREAFARVGSEYSFALTQMKFEPFRHKDGSAIIKVTSSNVIREPFLDFLVEVNWPNGRLVREYTVLLDPPVTTKRRAATIRKPAVASTTQTAPVQSQTATTQSGYTPSVSADEYGPVAANETLWEIAAELKPQGVSIHQMMMALLHANPQAFINNNVNLLKKGKVLRVPDVSEAQMLNRQEAVSSFKQQTDDWMAGTAGASDLPVSAEMSGDAEVEKSQSLAEDADARLEIAAATTGSDGEVGATEADADQADSEGLRQELMIARENVETSRQEMDDLKSQVSDMEDQVEDLNRLLTLKDEELAQLQAAAGTATDDAVTPPDEELSQESQILEVPADTDETVDQQEQEQEQALESDVEPMAGDTLDETADQQQEVTAVTDIDYSEPAEELSAAIEDSVEETSVAEPEPEAAAATETPVAQLETEVAAATEAPVEPVADTGSKQSSWLEDNLIMIGAVAGGLFGVGLLIALFGGNREKKTRLEDAHSADEGILLNTSGDAEGVTSKAKAEHDTSFLSEYSTEDLHALQEDTAEVDPVAEADVYIAYGRYEQAQRILADAIDAGDDSAATRYKMLEVYFATQEKQHFVELAESMLQHGQDKEDTKAWAHIQTMGKELDKFNPLFGGAAATEVADESELTLDLSRLAAELDSTLNEDTEPMDGLESLDLDLSAFSVDDGGKSDKTSAEGDEADKGELELESALAETELNTEMIDLSQLAELGTNNALDDELADLSSDLLDVMADSAILDEPLDMDDDTFNLQDEATQKESEESASGSDQEITFTEPVEDIEIGGESDTKLQLAKAYMEMGDREGALSILREVQEDGTEEQIDSASELISRLNS